jgi:hypothetical protein
MGLFGLQVETRMPVSSQPRTMLTTLRAMGKKGAALQKEAPPI